MGLTKDDYGDFKDYDGNTVEFVKWPRARSGLLVKTLASTNISTIILEKFTSASFCPL